MLFRTIGSVLIFKVSLWSPTRQHNMNQETFIFVALTRSWQSLDAFLLRLLVGYFSRSA